MRFTRSLFTLDLIGRERELATLLFIVDNIVNENCLKLIINHVWFKITEPFMNDLKIISGDSLRILPTLESESIQACVTSPPYWGLRDYDHDSQIGAEPSPELYVENIVAVFREVRRVLKNTGTLWLNVGDGYARNGGKGNCGPNATVGNTKKLIQKRNCKVPDCWGLKDRDLFGLPWRVAFALQADGWILRSKITWIKKNAMPESVKNRPTSATEEIFLLAKNPKYYYDQNGIREESGANLRNYWVIGRDSDTNGHPATFPRELARRCILLGSREKDTILDPFSGSGTTGVAAIELKRKAVLIELNPNYIETSKKRSSTIQPKIFASSVNPTL
jgi:site-specific DNA-methyltransferase (cytosine-N4-specific)